MIRQKILVVDDDQDILDLLHYNLQKAGYDVRTLESASSVLREAQSFLPDLIIMDVVMPGNNGIELCRLLRMHPQFINTYIFFLTARSEHYYQQAVFQTGGDDFIQKITGIKALMTKVDAVLRTQVVIRKCVSEVTVNDLHLSRKNFSVSYHTRKTKLSDPEFELLFFLAQNRDRSVSLDLVAQCVWGTDTHSARSSIEMYLDNIHRKIGCSFVERKSDHYRFHID